MNVQRTRLLLRTVAVSLLLVTTAVVVWAFQSPDDLIDHGDDPAARKRAGTARAKLVTSPPLEDLAAVWSKELRQPLYDPPQEPKKPIRSEKKDNKKKRRNEGNLGGGVQLVGTMLEDGRSMAIFMNSSGKIDLKGVGETLELAPESVLDRIDQTEVTISTRGRASTLSLPNTKAR